MHALELRIVAFDLRAGEGNRNGLAAARAYHGLARLLRRLLQIEMAHAHAHPARSRCCGPASSSFAVAEQLAGGCIDNFHYSFRGGNEHRIGHAVEHAVQIVAVDRGLAQPPAHPLQSTLQLAELVAPARYRADGCSRPGRCARRRGSKRQWVVPRAAPCARKDSRRPARRAVPVRPPVPVRCALHSRLRPQAAPAGCWAR